MTLRILLFLGALLGLPVTPVLAGDLVVLHSSRGEDGWTRAVAASVCPADAPDCRVSELFLGPAWLGDDFFEDCYDRFSPAWGSRRPDAVIADGESAFAFVRKYREELFGGAPVVWMGMARPDPALAAQCGACAGVPLEPDVRGTVDLVFRLRPETSLVVGIMDGSPESLRLKALAEAAMAPYLDRAQVVFPGYEPGDDQGLAMDGPAAVASSVPRSGAVLFLGFERDRTGAEADEAGLVRTVAERSEGPVYVLADRWPGSGVLGGLGGPGQGPWPGRSPPGRAADTGPGPSPGGRGSVRADRGRPDRAGPVRHSCGPAACGRGRAQPGPAPGGEFGDHLHRRRAGLRAPGPVRLAADPAATSRVARTGRRPGS